MVLYGISEVSYNAGHQHISQVRQHLITNQSADGGQIVARAIVVQNLRQGADYITMSRCNGGTQWCKGADVDVVDIYGQDYIRTDANRTASDNLGELPEF